MNKKTVAISLSLAAFSLSLSAAAPATTERSSIDGAQEPTLILNQHLLEGWQSNPSGLNLEEPDDVFFHIFNRLPAGVTVYPGENYWSMDARFEEISVFHRALGTEGWFPSDMRSLRNFLRSVGAAVDFRGQNISPEATELRWRKWMTSPTWFG